MKPRRALPLKVKLASALSQMLRADESGNLVPVIPREQAKRMDADAVLAVFDWDHIHPVALGGDDHHSNLTPLPKADHKAKTFGRAGESKLSITGNGDVSRIAKTKRLSRNQDKFHARLLAKDAGEAPPEPRRAKRKFPSRHSGKR